MLTAGQCHDGVTARPLLERIRLPRIGRGRPRCRPDHVVADKAYASGGFRAYLRKRGISHTIPEKQDQQRHRVARHLADGFDAPGSVPAELADIQPLRRDAQRVVDAPSTALDLRCGT